MIVVLRDEITVAEATFLFFLINVVLYIPLRLELSLTVFFSWSNNPVDFLFDRLVLTRSYLYFPYCSTVKTLIIANRRFQTFIINFSIYFSFFSLLFIIPVLLYRLRYVRNYASITWCDVDWYRTFTESSKIKSLILFYFFRNFILDVLNFNQSKITVIDFS